MKRDFSGEKYLVIEEQGDPINMIIGRYHRDTDNIDWYIRPHSQSDGIAAMTDLLIGDGFTIKTQPHRKKAWKPGFFQSIVLFIRHLATIRYHAYSWSHREPKKRGNALCFTAAFYDKGVWTKLTRHAHKQKVSVNSVMLSALNQACCECLLTSLPSKTTWAIPVNMRGVVTEGSDSGNVTSNITVRISPNATSLELDRKFKTGFKKGLHWGAWIFSYVISMAGKPGLRLVLGKGKAGWMGVFSNMGKWPGSAATGTIDDNITYFGGPPVNLLMPICSTCLIWNNRMTVSLQLHPSISSSPDDTQRTMERWVEILKQDVGIEDNEVRIRVVSAEEIKRSANPI